MKIKALVLLFVCMIVYMLSSCSAERRIARIAKNHNLTTIENRTLTDTVIVPEFVTSYAMPLSGSMFGKYTPKLSMSGMVRGDTVFVTVAQRADTIIITREVPVEVVAYNDNHLPISIKFAILAIISISIFCIYLIIKTLEKK